jgi:sulfur carrier protein
MPERSAQAFLRINGQMEPLNCGTLSALLNAKEIGDTARGVAVAINGTVIPRAKWPDTRLAAGDQIEIVRVRQGG